MARRRKHSGRKTTLEADPGLKDHGLFFSRAMLELPTPTEEEKALAQKVLGEKDFALFDLVRCGAPAQRIDARNRIAASHKGLVGKVLKSWMPDIFSSRDPAVSLDDAWSLGTLALYRAVETFDYTLGFRFSTHAVWWIISTFMRDLFPSVDGVRLPVHVRERMKRYRKLAPQCEDERELMKALDLDPNQFKKLQEAIVIYSARRNRFESLKRTMDSEGGNQDPWSLLKEGAVEDFGEEPDQVVIGQMVSAALAKLDERERMVLSRRFGIGQHGEETLQEIANTEGVSRERIRQIESKALKKLEKYLGVRRDQIL